MRLCCLPACSANLLWRWGDVAQLGRELPRLRVLNLADNRLEALTEGLAVELAGCLPALQVRREVEVSCPGQ